MIGQFPPQVCKVYCVIQGDITRIYEFLRSKLAAPSQLSPQLTSMADCNPPSQNYRTVCLTENPRNQNAWYLEKYPYQWSRPIGKQHKMHPQIFQLIPAFLNTNNEYMINNFYKNPDLNYKPEFYSPQPYELTVCVNPASSMPVSWCKHIHQHPDITQHTRKVIGPTIEITGYSSIRNNVMCTVWVQLVE